jgi:hypothetical protein
VTRRLAACVEAWPGCSTGDYDPHCCRFPKSCSCTVYGDEVTDADLEPAAEPRQRPDQHEGRIMTTYHLNLTVEQFEPSTPDGQDGTSVTVARVNGEFDDPAMAASHLRAVADRLDPPKPPRPAYRRPPAGTGITRAAVERGVRPVVEPMYPHDPECNTIHDGSCPPPVTVDHPGDRIDVPDAALTTRAVTKVVADVMDRARRMEPHRRA